jgi:hypothetical protein
MTDQALIDFARQYDYIPAMVCKPFRQHSHYDDMVSAARCGMLAAATRWERCTGVQPVPSESPSESPFAPLATTIARREALRYLNRLSRTVWPGKRLQDQNGHDTLSLDLDYGDDENPHSLLDSLPSPDHDPAHRAAMADDINHMLTGINQILHQRTAARPARRSCKGVHRHAAA